MTASADRADAVTVAGRTCDEGGRRIEHSARALGPPLLLGPASGHVGHVSVHLIADAPAEAPIATDRGAHPSNYTDGFENFFQAVAPGDIAADVRSVWDDAVAMNAYAEAKASMISDVTRHAEAWAERVGWTVGG